jgi:hypothetical protein
LSIPRETAPGADAVPLLFALTMFVSATLLFLVQPMVGKMILPLLGGTPAVWNTCMVFYQGLLLAGYFYAHKATANLDAKKQTSLHTFVLFAALGVLLIGALLSANHSPIPVVKSLSPQGSDYPFFGVVVLLAAAIGLPFFVVSTSAPLLQKWFAETGHPSAKDPYFLYAASNVGSLLALVAYPAVVEPNLRLVHQAWVWAVGYAILVGLVMMCARAVRQGPPPLAVSRAAAKPQAAVTIDEPPPPLARKLRWLALAFVPSSLMLGVTTFVSTDMASIPLLWIIPLSLYLITFIIVFSKVPKELHLLLTLLMPVMVLLIAFLMTSHVPAKFGLQVLLHMATFFIVAMVCHGELARERPAPKYLTGFYLTMSLGGMLGGLFNALIAPIVFTYTSEYPITLVAACFLLPPLFQENGRREGRWATALDVIFPLGVFFLCRQLQTYRYPIGEYAYAHGLWMLAALAAFAAPAAAAVFGLEKELRARVVLAVLLGASLAIFGITGPLLEAAGLKGSLFSSGDLDVSYKLLARLGLAALPMAAFAWYWRVFGDRAAFRSHLLAGVAALAGCFAVMLFMAQFVADEFFGVIAFKARISLDTVRQILIYGVPAMLCYFFVERPVRFGLAVAALWLASFYTEYREGHNPDVPARFRTYNDRSFFGRLKIERYGEWDGIPGVCIPDAVLHDEDTYEPERNVRGSDVVDWVFKIRDGDIPVYRIREMTGESGEKERVASIRREYVQLVHGTTVHGLQEANRERLDIARALLPVNGPNLWGAAIARVGPADEPLHFPGRDPLTYYHRTGPVGSMFAAWEELNRGQRRNTDVACIGLGTGSLSAYGRPGQTLTFFEIDTHVRRLVEPRDYFTFIDAAKRQGVNIEFEMGDARVSLERLDGRKYGFMLIDAFSSDAIPAHLLTKEAVELYFQRLEDDGLLAIHTSNRYLELEPVVERICRELKLEARVMHGTSDSKTGKYAATWIAIARSKEALGPIAEDTDRWHEEGGKAKSERWIPIKADDKVGLWTDDYSPIIPILRGEWRFWAKSEE